MNMRSPENVDLLWESAVDSLSQFVCLLDREGRVIRANRAIERWERGIDVDADSLTGRCLHDALHSGCDDSGCYLRRFEEQAGDALARHSRADIDAWDPILKRYFLIRAHRPVAQPQADDSRSVVFAVVTVDDMTEWIRAEEASRASKAALRQLAAQHLTIQESERRRIAADLHDGLGQSLSLVKLSIEDAARSVRDGVPGRAATTLERLAPTVKSALEELRRMSMNLRPATLDDLGILATLAWYFRELEATCPNVALERDISVKESDVADLLKIAIFRIVQEATSNALKHAKADRIKVSLSNERDCVELLIEDTGVGFDPAAVAASRDCAHGLGLRNMKERAELSGASYELHSAPGKGTSICVRWPSLAAFEHKPAAAPQPLFDPAPKRASP